MDINELLPPRVAVVELSGVIGLRLHSREFNKLLTGVRENRRIKAVVLDIDSPGGIAHSSEDIYLAAQQLGQAKPLVASIRGVGASGAYMVACAAERIFAIPSAIVGSIGVISARPMVAQLLDKVGVEMVVSKSGRFKDMGSLFREPTEEERAKEQKLIDAIHGRFLEIVSAGRAEVPPERVREMATGEVYTGTQALEVGLIDEVGNLDNAVRWAARRAGIPAKTIIVRPRRGLAQMLLQRGAESLVDDISAAMLERLYAGALGVPLH